MTVSNPADVKSPGTFSSQPVGWGILWLGLAVVGAAAFFWDGFVSLLEAWQRPEYSHGYLIPLIAAFLFLRQIKASDQNERVGDRTVGLLILVVSLIVGLLGNLARIPDIITYGFLICVAGFILVLAGTRRGLQFWAPWLYLGFMLPLPNFLYWPLSIKLQAVSSKIGVAMISKAGVPVYLEGNIIDLGVYKLQVAEACSGLNYLFPLMSFGFLFAVLYRGPAWQKVVLFLSAIPITVFMNSARIGVIGVLVDAFGISQAEGFLHFFEGWVIFVACVAILYLEAVVLQRFLWGGKHGSSVLDLDTTGLGAKLQNARSAAFPWHFGAAALIVFVAGVTWHLSPARSDVSPNRDRLALFPLVFADWRGKSVSLEPTIERVLGADDYLVANYNETKTGRSVNLFIAYYASQTNGSGIHSPEVCIPSSGWEISEWTQIDTKYRTQSGLPLHVNRAIIQKGLDRQLVYYWFEQRGRQLTSDYMVKAYTVWDSVAKGRSDGALMRMVTPIGRQESVGAADQRLGKFLSVAYPNFREFVPDA